MAPQPPPSVKGARGVKGENAVRLGWIRFPVARHTTRDTQGWDSALQAVPCDRQGSSALQAVPCDWPWERALRQSFGGLSPLNKRRPRQADPHSFSLDGRGAPGQGPAVLVGPAHTRPRRVRRGPEATGRGGGGCTPRHAATPGVGRRPGCWAIRICVRLRLCVCVPSTEKARSRVIRPPC